LYPPGAGADSSKVEKFTHLVHDLIRNGGEVELQFIGAPSMRHTLRAFRLGRHAVEFEPHWIRNAGDADVHTEADSDKRTATDHGLDEVGQGMKAKLRIVGIVAREGVAWEDFSRDIQAGHFVSNSTQISSLARKIAIELRGGKRVTLHTYDDAEQALAVILKALATAPDFGNGRRLRCTVGDVRLDGESSVRIIVHAQCDMDVEEQDRSPSFVAFPPGPNPKPDVLQRFTKAVRSRLQSGHEVKMECRGPHATSRAMIALAGVQQKTAEFNVRWVDSSLADGVGEARALLVRVSCGQTWEEFNATDFSRTKVLFLTPSTVLKELARTIGSEAKTHGGVALHFNALDKRATHNALKALASVPVEHAGLRVVCVPSLGRAKDDKPRALRLYVRQARSGAPAAPGSTSPQPHRP